jgi:hypothetical protein
LVDPDDRQGLRLFVQTRMARAVWASGA